LEEGQEEGKREGRAKVKGREEWAEGRFVRSMERAGLKVE